ncbi:MAG TPA: porin family protein [Cytophagaceae bacterium]
MYQTNFWNKFFIHREKIVILLFLVFAGTVNAQDHLYGKDNNRIDKNLPEYDNKRLHYGFTIGLNATRFRPVQSEYYFTETDTVAKIEGVRTPGFSLGFILNLKLADFVDLRLLPTVAFYQRDVNFTFQEGKKSTQTTESTFIEFPLLLKYKSQRRGNLRVYVLGGIKAGIEAGAKKKEKKETELRTNNKDFAIDYGVGFDIYYPLFKFSPEIRVSHGLANMLNRDPNIFSQSLKSLNSHTITLYLHFN